MKDLINDIIGFLSTLTGIDLLLYCAVLFLILLVVCLAYIIKNTDEDEEITDLNNSELNLKDVVKTLEKEKEAPLIHHTSYEEEQEEKAIISYDELLAQNENKNTYNEEIIDNDELTIKKINLTKKILVPELPKDKKESGEKKEQFFGHLKLFLQQLEN